MAPAAAPAGSPTRGWPGGARPAASMPVLAQTSGPARRFAVAVSLGFAAFVLSELLAVLPPTGVSDFADLWHGVVAWRAGGDPYATVRALHPAVALYYPLPALILCWP